MPLILLAAALSGMAVAAAEPSDAAGPPPSLFDAYYPPAARAAGLEGYVVLSCINLANGRLSRCEVVEETPKGQGFGQASLRAADQFRLDLRTKEGAPVEGASVKIPIHWRLDHPAPAPGTTPAAQPAGR
jgi:TonB family protein